METGPWLKVSSDRLVKPGFEPATPGLQGKLFVHYTTAAPKTCLKRPLKKKTRIGFQDQLSLNAGQKYCRMLQGGHSSILSTCIKLPFVLKVFVLSIGRLRQVLLYTFCLCLPLFPFFAYVSSKSSGQTSLIAKAHPSRRTSFYVVSTKIS